MVTLCRVSVCMSRVRTLIPVHMISRIHNIIHYKQAGTEGLSEANRVKYIDRGRRSDIRSQRSRQNKMGRQRGKRNVLLFRCTLSAALTRISSKICSKPGTNLQRAQDSAVCVCVLAFL
jgi:hypothetical protein